MAENLLTNPGFEGGTTRETNRWKPGGLLDHLVVGEIETPTGWVTWWRDGFPGPGAADQLTGQPEVKVLRLPNFQDARRIRSGTSAVLGFTFWRNHDFGLQQVVAVEAGLRYGFSIFAHSWHSECDTKPHDVPLAKDCKMKLADSHDWVSVGIDPAGGADPFAAGVVWSAEREAYGGYPAEPLSVEAVASGDWLTVFVRARTMFALKHCDLYLDDAELVEVTGGPEPEPEPEPGVRKYDAFRVLCPQDLTRDEWLRVHDVYEVRNPTFTQSADDAMAWHDGLLSLNVMVVAATQWVGGKAGLEDFRDTNYPRAVLAWDDLTLATAPVPQPDSILLAQRDPRWVNLRFGASSCNLTIGQSGCFITSLAMAQRWYGIKADATPVTVNAALTPSGYVECKATWAAINAKLSMTISGGTEAQVRTHLMAGGCALADVLPEAPQHFVLVTAYTGGRYWMYDPWLNVAGWLDDYRPYIDSWRILTKQGAPPEPEPPVPPTPEPGSGDRPVRYGVPSVHVQTWDGQEAMTYLSQVRPAVAKVFSLEDVRGVLAASDCQTRVVVRMARDYPPDDPLTGPAIWIGYWLDGLRSTYAALQREFGERLLPGSVYFEEPNEWIGGDRAVNLRRRDYSIQFCEDLVRLAPGWRPACYCVPIGNPPEDQYADWIAAAQAFVHYGAAAGYHAYWIPNTDWERDWRWLQGRWAYMDAVWKAAGYEVDWYLGEAGVVEGYFYPDSMGAMLAALDLGRSYAASEDDPYAAIRGRAHEGKFVYQDSGPSATAALASGSYWLNSGDDAGWRVKAYQGNWARYQADWQEMTRRCRAFGPRQWGPCAFTVGAPYVHWESFKMRDPEWRALRPLMMALPVG